MRAVTRALGAGAPIDPVAVAGDDGVLFANDHLVLAGRGRAALLAVLSGEYEGRPGPGAERWLAAVPTDADVEGPGTGPVALGALPFEAAAPAQLVVPELLYGRAADGTEWVTVVGDGDPAPPDRRWLAALERVVPHDHGGRAQVVDCQPADYADAVAKAVQAIRAGSLRKVVLARRLTVETARPVTPSAMVARLRDDEPACTAFLVAEPTGSFLGASPELLVSRRDRVVVSHPLAGTVAIDETVASERGRRLLASAKDLEEHEVVVADISGVLDPLCSELVVPAQPSLVPLSTMAHLGTRIEGRLLAESQRVPSVLELVAALHPTAAVGGVPRAEALQLITALEPGPRGRWAGPVGWVDARGDGDWVVGLRSATVSGTTVTLWAGAGIVAASDPEAELAETSVKLAPVLEGLSRGCSALLGPPLR